MDVFENLLVCWSNGWKYLSLIKFSLVKNVVTYHRTLCFLTYLRLKEVSAEKCEEKCEQIIDHEMYKYKAKDATLSVW